MTYFRYMIFLLFYKNKTIFYLKKKRRKVKLLLEIMLKSNDKTKLRENERSNYLYFLSSQIFTHVIA